MGFPAFFLNALPCAPPACSALAPLLEPSLSFFRFLLAELEPSCRPSAASSSQASSCRSEADSEPPPRRAERKQKLACGESDLCSSSVAL